MVFERPAGHYMGKILGVDNNALRTNCSNAPDIEKVEAKGNRAMRMKYFPEKSVEENKEALLALSTKYRDAYLKRITLLLWPY